MQRPTSEAHLISALLNTQTVDDAAAYGITADMFVTHQPEFRWVQSHSKIYGTDPSAEALHSRFPDFPLTTAVDTAFFCDEVRQDHTKRTFVQVIKDAAYKVQQGDLEEAKAIFQSTAPRYQSQPGLIRKYYVLSEDGMTAGGVYLWQSREAADALYTDEWRAFVTGKYGTPPQVVYMACPVVVDNTTRQILVD